MEEKRVSRDGTGRKHSPCRNWLPHLEAEWAKDPLHQSLHPDPMDAALIARLRKGRGIVG